MRWLGVLLMLSGCHPLPVMSPSDVEAPAFERWYRATGRYPSPSKITYRKGRIPCNGGSADGCYLLVSNQIVVRNDLGEDGNMRVLMHELGHDLAGRRDHVEPPTIGVMTTIITSDFITAADLEYVCRDIICEWQRPEVP